MTKDATSLQRAIEDARALLGTVCAGNLKEAYVASGETEIFIAREAGRPNPMRHAGFASARKPETSSAGTLVAAPHVATVIFLGDLGANFGKDAPMVKLRVLDDTIDINAPKPGCVVETHVELGEFVEFGAPLVTFLEDPH